MEQWLPRRPLILAPLIPLIWTVSWLGTMTIRHAFGFAYPNPNQLQDSVLIVSAVVLIANIYNLILIYQQTEKYRNAPRYSQNALLLAIILIISIVLAWGQPKKILIPNRLTSGVVTYIILNCGLALLANYFVRMSRPPTRQKRASLLLPVAQLAITAFISPLVFITSAGWGSGLLGGILLVAFGFAQWNNMAGLFNPAPATKSGIYQILLGINLTTVLTTIFCGFDTFVMTVLKGKIELVAACFIQSIILASVTGVIIAAMQRYKNDYRYGHAVGNEIKYLITGILLTVTFLLLTSWLLVH